MRILVTGSRKFNSADSVFIYFTQYEGDIELIIHGGARGADSLAEAYAFQNGIHTKIVRPVYPSKKDYYLHRNAEMVGMCDEVVAFWDGKSRGTKFTINYAKKRGKKVTVIKEEGENGQ